ncbi:conserved hypothetical protein [Histoplasma capsulatum H143]|uniref:Uncharacterized protein n=1 Tax=Ajellomyces capsulatus (strain H143) TaxID=544712 RepID=C6HRT7_AJECH|nr:conserved hypothetical protein [Histoplasma capsulatum H143]
MVSSPNAKRPAKSGNARTSKQLPLAPSQRARPSRPPFQSAPVQAAPPRTRSINPKGLTVCAIAAFCFSTYGTYLTVKQSKNLSVPDDVSDRFHKTAPTYDANVELTERIMRISKKREELGNGNGSKSLPTSAEQQQSCTFDTVIQTMGLCSLPDPVSYLKHLGTLVEPERGEILLLEHGRSHYRWLNKLLDDLAAAHADRHGCWWNRDIGEIVRQSGLEIVESKRWHMGTTWRFILRRKEGAGRGEKDLGLAEVSEREENGDGAAKSAMGWLGWGAEKS